MTKTNGNVPAYVGCIQPPDKHYPLYSLIGWHVTPSTNTAKLNLTGDELYNIRENRRVREVAKSSFMKQLDNGLPYVKTFGPHSYNLVPLNREEAIARVSRLNAEIREAKYAAKAG